MYSMSGNGSDANDEKRQTPSERLHWLQQENDRINRRLESINEQWYQLGLEHKSLLMEQEKLRKRNDLRATIDAHSREATIEIAQRMQSKLPRELRDIIQTYLWDPELPNHFHPTRNEDDLPCMFRHQCPGRPCDCLKHTTVHPWLDSDWVGPDTALESAEMVYRKVVGMYADSPEMIIQQLYADPFHVGFTPVKIIDSFTVEINVDYCLRKQRRSIEASKAQRKRSNQAIKPYSLLDTLAEAAEHLRLVSNKRDFILDIALEQRYIRPSVLSEIIKVLKPTIEVLEEEGAEINIRFTYYNEKGTRDPNQAKFVFDLSEVHKESGDEWKEELIANLDNTPWILKHHRAYANQTETWFNARSDCDYRRPKEIWADVEDPRFEDDGKDPLCTRDLPASTLVINDEGPPKKRKKRRRQF